MNNENPFRFGDLTYYEFSREMVATCDFKSFLDHFALERLPHGEALRKLCDNFHFAVAGYDHDERELYEIQEGRKFYQAFRRAWPYWLFFCDLDQPALQTMTFCCLPSLELSRRQGARLMRVCLPAADLDNFLEENIAGLNQLCERAGMTDAENQERTENVIAYYEQDWSHLAHAPWSEFLLSHLTQTMPKTKP